MYYTATTPITTIMNANTQFNQSISSYLCSRSWCVQYDKVAANSLPSMRNSVVSRYKIASSLAPTGVLIHVRRKVMSAYLGYFISMRYTQSIPMHACFHVSTDRGSKVDRTSHLTLAEVFLFLSSIFHFSFPISHFSFLISHFSFFIFHFSILIFVSIPVHMFRITVSTTHYSLQWSVLFLFDFFGFAMNLVYLLGIRYWEDSWMVDIGH